ncbi:receptor-type guanylate cyclase gcy-28 [Caerostris extrusa]|uniref:Receptor-type guanylate cyclase gcy-28 n=1 Tax=Caerostris extrusa TaxID=172846 RepID=A0AAV4TC95_CAEEX|nr:receptor-type guanylate cyclase gcy-28 [Caerostris extrusa]
MPNFPEELRISPNSTLEKPYGKEEVNTYVTAFHDAVILYSLAVNETLKEGLSLKNGTLVTQKCGIELFEGCC